MLPKCHKFDPHARRPKGLKGPEVIVTETKIEVERKVASQTVVPAAAAAAAANNICRHLGSDSNHGEC